jgi:tetratricopeptide (TPR) repeat protein
MSRRLPTSALFPALALTFVVSFGLPSATFAQERHAQIYLDNLGEPEDGSDDLEEHDQLLLPDILEDGEGAGPLPHSAQENKQDKLDLDLGGALQPIDRTKFLAELYDRLAAARNAQAAQPVMETIEQLWRISGSATIDLLIARAEQFIKESDLDLALKILDAAADISPEDAEIWHQRAQVYILKQSYERALADLRRTLSIDPRHYRAINELGRMQEELGDKKEALRTYREALKVNPFLDDARRAVDSLSREVEGQDI